MFISVLPLDFYMFKNFVALMPENISKDFRFVMLFTSITAHQFLAMCHNIRPDLPERFTIEQSFALEQ